MELPDRISEPGTGLKISAALAVLLLVGFTASSIDNGSSITSSPSYSGGHTEKLDRAKTQDLATSRESERTTDESDSKVVTTYRMTLEVSNVDTAIQDIESGVRQRGGFIESISRSQDRENRGTLTVSVPANISESYEDHFQERYRIKSKDVDRRNVEDSYNEIEAEIQSLEAEYRRLNELINQTDDVETLIKLQERLSEVRSSLDYRKQRLERLDEDVKYSTFRITLEGPQSFESRFNLYEAVSDSYTAVFKSFRLIILGAGYLVPFALIYGIFRAARRIKDRGI